MVENSKERIKFPKRAIITAGMPNGNKELHIGHISTFIWADTISRFLKNIIGEENVLFLSATDSYGSMVIEKLKTWQAEDGFTGTAYDVVRKYHDMNMATINEYNIGFDMFGATCFDPLKSVHENVSNEVFETLLKNGTMSKRSTLLFYDEKYKQFLNGRQVVGKCPIANCTSEEAYADECALGHQYSPVELIDPVSKLSGTRPVLRESANYYFDLPRYKAALADLADNWESRPNQRKAMIKEMKDFLGNPLIYIHENSESKLDTISATLPKHNRTKVSKNIILEFAEISLRESAAETLFKNGIRFRTGKTLAPFRITGNSTWGVPVPKQPADEPLSFYVWPESLWAPISETKNCLTLKKSTLTWKDFWCDPNNAIYQIVGEDNIYFYALCEPALFKSLDWGIIMPTIISNKHTLIGGAKAASSGVRKAPTARELLDKYTVEQIKMYFLSQNVTYTTSEFRSKAFFPDMFKNEEDPFIAPGNILTNIFNRIVRSVFYTIGKYFDNKMPFGAVSNDVYLGACETLQAFERNMMNFELNKNVLLLDVYFRNANKAWAKIMTEASKSNDMTAIKSVVINTLFIIKTGIMMLYCITPEGCNIVANKLNLKPEVFDWKNTTKPIYDFCNNKDYQIAELEPRFDFFKKHPSQFI